LRKAWRVLARLATVVLKRRSQHLDLRKPGWMKVSMTV
jgi:hypothetical protein